MEKSGDKEKLNIFKNVVELGMSCCGLERQVQF